MNPPNRFDRLHVEEYPELLNEEERRSVPTQFLEDNSQTVLARNDSPDVPFSYSLNPYRGCEHGCVYCYARPSHEYLGYSAGVDFETRILVKSEAPNLLADHFEKGGWNPQVVALSGNTDPYQPAERQFALTRSCLKVFLHYRNPVSIITKNYLVSRDIDLLAEMACLNLVNVRISITSLDDHIIADMEPRTSRPARRLKAIERLSDAGIPTGVMVAPVIPGLTDEEIPSILEKAYEAGARSASWIPVRLPGPVEPIFEEWLSRVHPSRADKIRARIRSLRAGSMNDSSFGTRMRGEGPWADVLCDLFSMTAEKLGYRRRFRKLATHHFRRSQGELF